MTKSSFYMAILLMAIISAGCETRNPPSSSAPGSQSKSAAPAASNITDQWLGKWIGPEGTFLVLSKNGDHYEVEINSLDGPATYAGTSAGDRIKFQRNGRTESIHAGNGQDTGMKWLLDKKNCLIIKTGEGFCRE